VRVGWCLGNAKNEVGLKVLKLLRGESGVKKRKTKSRAEAGVVFVLCIPQAGDSTLKKDCI
jgi:hypothetical protein